VSFRSDRRCRKYRAPAARRGGASSTSQPWRAADRRERHPQPPGPAMAIVQIACQFLVKHIGNLAEQAQLVVPSDRAYYKIVVRRGQGILLGQCAPSAYRSQLARTCRGQKRNDHEIHRSGLPSFISLAAIGEAQPADVKARSVSHATELPRSAGGPIARSASGLRCR
jgi:hypothetical protein